MPSLVIIAGPNGAGKSTTSTKLLEDRGIEAFDFDKEFYNTWKLFGYDPAVERGVRESTEAKFIEAKQTAILTKTEFAFETNFNTATILETVNEFKSNGFDVYLIFISLLNEEHAIARVKNRVANGGHAVEEKTIRERFKQGLELLDNSFKEFKSIVLHFSTDNDSNVLVYIEDVAKNIVKINQGIPQGLKEKLPKFCRYLKQGKRLRHGF